MLRRVVLTGVGVVGAGVVGGWAALSAYLAGPRAAVRRDGGGVVGAFVDDAVLASLIDVEEARRWPRVSQLTVGAARLALADAGIADAGEAGLIVGTELGDLRTTLAFADGYLRGGPGGLSPLLFPSTVMNAMAASTTIAVAARGMALTLNASAVAGQLAVARAVAAVGAGRLDMALAGGVDEVAPAVRRILAEVGAAHDLRGEGATFVVVEAEDRAVARGARVLGEIRGAASRALRARPHGVSRVAEPRAVRAALAVAGCEARGIRWILGSASGDGPRDDWERRLLDAAFAPASPPVSSLVGLLGHHAGLGALTVGAAAWTAGSGVLVHPSSPAAFLAGAAPGHGAPIRVGRGPGLVHGIARGGIEVALVVDRAGDA
jgi:3-oxoacyl-[acyl-carrier-protein] synthase II